MLSFPDIIKHTNETKAVVDTDFVRGGRRSVANLVQLYALNSVKDQLKQDVTIVRVTSLAVDYILTDINNVDSNLGWSIYNTGGGGIMINNSDDVPEGVDNLYFTAARQAVINESINNLSNAITDEANARIATDNSLQTDVGVLTTGLSDEVAARQYADSVLQDLIDDEVLNRQTAIANLLDGVATPGNTLQKLYNLILGSFTEIVVADITARDALNITHTPTNVFVQNDGDGNWALYKALTTGVAATYIKISDPDLLNAVMSASQIKASYESNPDTNAFTNALLTKLNSIASGATVNSTDAYLLSRSNHTGTQAASTITGLAAVATSGNKSDVGLGNVPNIDATNPANIYQSANYRFASDTEKASWNGKQDALTKATAAEINAGADASKYLTSDQLAASKYLTQDGNKLSATATGTNNYSAIIAPAITAYAIGQRFFITFTNANTGACTLNLNSLGAKNIYKNVNIALVSGDIVAGQTLLVSYDGTNFQVIGSLFPYTVDNLYETDSDVIAAITAAIYSPENNFKSALSSVLLNGKTFYQGKKYDDGTFLYEAVTNNTAKRIGSEAPFVEYAADATLPVAGATVSANGSTSTLNLTLNASTVKGALFYIRNIGSVAVKILQNASQKIYFRNASNTLQSSTTGVTGSVTLNEQYGSVTIECVATNIFVITQLAGTLTFV